MFESNIWKCELQLDLKKDLSLKRYGCHSDCQSLGDDDGLLDVEVSRCN